MLYGKASFSTILLTSEHSLKMMVLIVTMRIPEDEDMNRAINLSLTFIRPIPHSSKEWILTDTVSTIMSIRTSAARLLKRVH